MTNPDLPSPVALNLHSITESELVEAMVSAFQLAVPEWVPQEGATEVVLFETFALSIGQFIHALNQIPRVVLDGLIALRGFARKDPVPAAGQIEITVSASSLGTRVLPAGATFRVPTENEGVTVDMKTVEEVSINPSDDLVGTVNVIAAVPGSAPNGIATGTVAVMVDAYTWIESAIVSFAFGGGGDIEDDANFYGRVAAAFQSQTETLVTESQFAAKALQHPSVGRARGYGRWDGVGANGTMQGHVTVAVAGPDGANVTSQVKSEVLSSIATYAVAGLQVHVVDFLHVSFNLAVTYSLAAGYSAAVVSPQIEAVLRGWINPATWPYAETLTSVNQIILRIGTVPGVDNVTAVTGWSPVTGGATLPAVGTISFTVV